MNWIGNHLVAGLVSDHDDPMGEPIGESKNDLMMSKIKPIPTRSLNRNNRWIGARVELFQLRQVFWRNVSQKVTSRISLFFS